jgi:hypothetical protein
MCIKFVGKHDGKRILDRFRCRWEDGIDLREIGWENMECMRMAQDGNQWRAV